MRIRWLHSNRFNKVDLKKAISGIADEPFEGNINSGFLLERRRNDFVEAKYVEKFDWVETVKDPFGESQDLTRREFQQTSFRLSVEGPTLEIYDAPRSISPLLNRLEVFLGLGFSVASPEIELIKWLHHIDEAIENVVVNSVGISKLSLSTQTYAQVSIRGTEDVRSQVASLIGKRAYKLDKLVVSGVYEELETRFMLRNDGRATILKGDENLIPILRDSLARTLDQQPSVAS